jgi:hypothetical protein
MALLAIGYRTQPQCTLGRFSINDMLSQNLDSDLLRPSGCVTVAIIQETYTKRSNDLGTGAFYYGPILISFNLPA